MRRSTEIIGPLTCHTLRPNEPAEAVVVLCHGFGACGTDLVPLADEMAARNTIPTALFLPEGPLDLADPGLAAGRAWWPLDLEHLLARQRAGNDASKELARHVFAGTKASNQALRRTIELVLQSTGLGYANLFLGGFSQGAMLACDVAFSLDEPPAALGIFSGALIDEARWRRLVRHRVGLQVVQSHGQSDPILPHQGAENLRALMASAGCQIEFLSFAGGHEIPSSAITAFSHLVAKAPRSAL